ncbi:MAG: DUF1493 family protein [Pseudomonadota bacterium]
MDADEFRSIKQFISDECDYDRDLDPDDDVFQRVGITGDDADEFIRAFETTFDVDMEHYLWYFHTEEEGAFNIGGLFFKSPDRLVSRIPITQRVLLDSVRAGQWCIEYPDHSIPETRRDLSFNIALGVTLVVLLIWMYAS